MTTLTLTTEEVCFLKSIIQGHIKKLEDDIVLSMELEKTLKTDEKKHIDYQNERIEKSWALIDKIEEQEKENFKK